MLAFTEMILETLRESPMLKYLKLRISGGYVLESLLGGPHLPSAGGAPPSRVISVSPLGSPTLRCLSAPQGRGHRAGTLKHPSSKSGPIALQVEHSRAGS